jgi:hypothetical protein
MTLANHGIIRNVIHKVAWLLRVAFNFANIALILSFSFGLVPVFHAGSPRFITSGKSKASR